LIIGASSRMAEHCARLWVLDAGMQPLQLLLAARDAHKLEPIAADLRVRGGDSVTVSTHYPDFAAPDQITQFVAQMAQQGPIDVALIAHGQLPDQRACEADPVLAAQAIQINALSPVAYAQALANVMSAQGHGTLAVIGSVAGDRGRQSNFVYGAAKALVDRYLQGLQHRHAGSGLRVVRIKPGPTATPMTAALAANGARLASPEQVARDIVSGIAQGRSLVYTPPLWRWIMLIVRHVPDVLFHRSRL
jgi:short-subunit dehydrogenase